MICRSCHYDLRGQHTPRCPECGRSFAPGDPGTFLTELPTLRSRAAKAIHYFHIWCRPRRIAIVVTATIIWLGMYAVALPSFSPLGCGRLRTPNLKMVMTEWQIQQVDFPTQKTFDKRAARRDMRPSFSHWTEASALQDKKRCATRMRALSALGVPAALYAGLIAALWTGRVRIVALSLAVACLLTFIPSSFHREISEWLYPGTHSFLSDYVYLDGVDFRAPAAERATLIAAYDWRTFIGGGQRLVAFADGHTDFLNPDEARSLFATQGIPYPESKDPNR